MLLLFQNKPSTKNKATLAQLCHLAQHNPENILQRQKPYI